MSQVWKTNLKTLTLPCYIICYGIHQNNISDQNLTLAVKISISKIKTTVPKNSLIFGENSSQKASVCLSRRGAGGIKVLNYKMQNISSILAWNRDETTIGVFFHNHEWRPVDNKEYKENEATYCPKIEIETVSRFPKDRESQEHPVQPVQVLLLLHPHMVQQAPPLFHPWCPLIHSLKSSELWQGQGTLCQQLNF